jgi:hypothetical protein
VRFNAFVCIYACVLTHQHLLAPKVVAKKSERTAATKTKAKLLADRVDTKDGSEGKISTSNLLVCALLTLAGDIDSGRASDFVSVNPSSDSDSDREEAEISDASDTLSGKKRKRSKAKKNKKGREDVKAIRKSTIHTNVSRAQATSEKNQQRAAPDKSGAEM